MYLANYKEYSEFVGDLLVRPGVMKLSKAKAKEIEKASLPEGVALYESLDGVQWDAFPLGVKQVYAQDERYRAYYGGGVEIDQYGELRRALERMNAAAGQGGSALRDGESGDEGSGGG